MPCRSRETTSCAPPAGYVASRRWFVLHRYLGSAIDGTDVTITLSDDQFAFPDQREGRPAGLGPQGEHGPRNTLQTGARRPTSGPVRTDHGPARGRHGQVQELVAVEGPLILTDDNGIEPTVRIDDRGQQRSRLRPLRPRQPPGVADVEELRHHQATAGNQVLSGLPLPLPRRLPILIARRRSPPIEREPQPTQIRLNAAAGPPDRPRLAGPPGQRILVVVQHAGHGHTPIHALTTRLVPVPPRHPNHDGPHVREPRRPAFST
jgi:hypothetical protein